MRAILFAAFALAACASRGRLAARRRRIDAAAATHSGGPRTARSIALLTAWWPPRINQTADLGNGLRVRPLEVLEDSRCPQNARCVWAGRLRLRVNVEGVGDREIHRRSAGLQTPRGDFALVAISPGPWTDWPEGASPAIASASAAGDALSALFAAFALAACAQPSAPAETPPPRTDIAERISADLARLDAELAAEGVVAAGIGEAADLGGGLIVRPIEVKEDSRCPADVECVWAGRLVLRADVSGIERELTLETPLETPQGIVLLAVAKPYPFHNWPRDELPIPPYRFGFRRG